MVKRNRIILLICLAIIIVAGAVQYLLPHLRIVLTVFDAVLILAALITIGFLYIRNLHHSIEEEKQQVNALFQYATQGIILTNKAGQIVLANPEAERLFGYDPDELLGQQVEVLLPQRVAEKHVGYRKDFYKQPSNRRMGHGRDLLATKKNGDEFPVEVSLSFYEQKGQFYVISFIVDITQRKVAERKMVEQHTELEKVTQDIRKLNAELETKVAERTTILREALQKLEKSQEELHVALSKEKELSEIKSRFVSMASHEFRTPLSTVLSSASLIQNYIKEEEQEKRQKHVKRIKDSVKHLNDLLEDFLNLGKIEEGRVRTDFQQFNVKEFLSEVTDEIRAVLKPGQSVQSEYSGQPVFSTDKRLLKNILINLLSNAAKFSPENSPIALSATRSDESLKISVQDKGIGIPEEDQHHLFTSFFRGKNAVNIQGTGLGLHIVSRYVELLHGNIKLESKLNVGTTIAIDLPNIGSEEGHFTA